MSNSDDRSNILTGIEACRPGSDDIASPELSRVAEAIAADDDLARHYAAVQQSDAAVAEAFRDVPPPAGLKERLLAALDDAEVDAAAVDLETSTSVVRHETTRPAPSRRWLIAGGIAAGVLIAAGIGLGIWNRPSPASQQQIAQVASGLHSGLSSESFHAESNPPQTHPPFAGLRRNVTSIGWTMVNGLGDTRAIAYAYRNPRGGTATLYVFRPKTIDPTLPNGPAAPVQSSGVTVGVWASGGSVYALVVDGGEHHYWSFVPKPDLAHLWNRSPDLFSASDT